MDVVIIGAGLAGSITKRVLDKAGINSVIYDAEKEWRASPISENLFSMSWSKTLGEKVVLNGLKTLESIVPISSIRFKTKAGYNDVMHVHPDKILVPYKKKEVQPEDFQGQGKVVIDCRGYWANGGGLMKGLAGQGLFVDGSLEQIQMRPTMNFVAPYSHQKLFQWDNKRVWYGDSTCVPMETYKKDELYYVERCVERFHNLIPNEFYGKLYFDVVHGIRPVVGKNKGYLKFSFTGERRITNTGGWKCGLIIYADHAQKILKYLKKRL